jgi:hypothetical protein
MEYVGNFEEGILRSCSKAYGLKSIDLNFNYFSSFYSVQFINDIFTNHVFFVVNYADSDTPNLHNKFKVSVISLFMV